MANRRKPIKWTIEQFIEAVKLGDSISDVLRILNLSRFGSSFAMVKRYIKELNLDTSHWTRRKYLKTRKWNPKLIPLENILIEGSQYNRKDLKKRLIKAGVLLPQCSICSLSKWLDSDISLHLDHINGINDDNRLENLRLLCPNCHSQTDTYCGRNIKINGIPAQIIKLCLRCNREFKSVNSKKQKFCSALCYRPSPNPKVILDKICIKCNTSFHPKENDGKFCSAKCYHNSTIGIQKPTKITWPSPEEMTKLVYETPCIQLSKKLGVSDKAIEKYCKKYGIKKPERGYWRKLETLPVPP